MDRSAQMPSALQLFDPELVRCKPLASLTYAISVMTGADKARLLLVSLKDPTDSSKLDACNTAPNVAKIILRVVAFGFVAAPK